MFINKTTVESIRASESFQRASASLIRSTKRIIEANTLAQQIERNQFDTALKKALNL